MPSTSLSINQQTAFILWIVWPHVFNLLSKRVPCGAWWLAKGDGEMRVQTASQATSSHQLYMQMCTECIECIMKHSKFPVFFSHLTYPGGRIALATGGDRKTGSWEEILQKIVYRHFNIPGLTIRRDYFVKGGVGWCRFFGLFWAIFSKNAYSTFNLPGSKLAIILRVYLRPFIAYDDRQY